MDLDEFKNLSEKQVHKSLNELFDRANLTKQEREIYLKYKNICEYWLLRSKLLDSKSFNPTHPNFIKKIAIVLLNLQSKKVQGAKEHLVKEMFSDKTIHKCYKTKNGVRSTKNSNNVENTYFELEILSFFLKNKFYIHLASDNIKGKKIPEFTAEKDSIKINVEAKNLNVDKLLDNIFGDIFISGIDGKLSEEDRDNGSKRILHQFERNYVSAIAKYLETDKTEYFIIFISTNYPINVLGKYAVDFINGLKQEWKEKNFDRLIGLVLPDTEKTFFIANEHCNYKVIKMVEKMNIDEYHNYVPEFLNL